jgi:tRNA dimethylallyltransferase
MHNLIVIVGPTGSGKSHLALSVASRFAGEIVSCDSVQVYRGFDIGTAKLGVQDRQGIPHHLIDMVNPGEVFTAGDYSRMGRLTLAEIAGRERVPVVVGGTGFYLRALIDGLSLGPPRDEALRVRLLTRETRHKGSLHRILGRLDSSAAQAIHPNDLNKSLRALEIRLLSAAPRTVLPTREPLHGFRVLKIGLNPDRAALNSRLDRRLAQMFAQGLIGEVRALLDSGASPLAKPFESLGYKEALRYIQGTLSFDESLQAAQRSTRQYAKRQMTWFRYETGVTWFNGFGHDVDIERQVHVAVRLWDR